MTAELSGFSSYLDLQELNQLPSPPAGIRPCRVHLHLKGASGPTLVSSSGTPHALFLEEKQAGVVSGYCFWWLQG